MVCRSKFTLFFALIFSFALLMATAVSAADTGWLSPTANVQNGNNDDWTNPSNAYTNGGGAATESGSDQHRFYNYGFVIPPGATITGIETKVDSWSSDSTGCQIGVDLSWNSGSSWSSEKTQSLTGSETTYTLGSSSDDWGSHTWTAGEFSNTAFRTRVNDIDPGNQCANDATTSLDWIQVKVHYTPDVCGSGIITGNEVCDDGNTANGDGCSSTCAVEDNFSCTGQPSVCAYENPQIPNSCGIDIALIIDSSGSIDGTELGQMKTAFKGFVDAFLPNTPSQFAVVEFDDTAALTQDYTNDITSIKGAIDSASSGGSTNWEDALEEAHAQFDNRANKPDIFIFASDGNPNRYGDSSTFATEATAVAQAVTDADAIKADGIRIITVGIGDNLDANNLIAISSADAYYDADFATLAADLAQLADDLCGGTVTVRKYVDGQPAQGWDFSAQASSGVLAESTGTTDIDGFATFNVENITGTASVDLAETLQGGYAFVNASCVADNQATGTIALNGVDDIAVGANDAVFCVVNNHLITFCGDSVTQNPNDAQVAEQCDVGASNGIACTPGYGSSCVYCDSSCGNVNLTGPFCGDQIVNGQEACEVGDQIADPEHYSCNAQTCILDYVPYCGDGNVDQGEFCDDSNNQDGDGCTNTCIIEICGDGIDNNGNNEACDDGNQVNDDACSNTCTANVCGDGVVNNGETCDDGVNNGVACEPGYNEVCDYCTSQCTPARATGPYCGDQIMNGAEECDGEDGVGAHQSCGETCLIVPLPYCGDNVINGQEACDDGNNADGDGCSANCAIEIISVCGDGVTNGAETCDDGNLADGDGCSSACETTGLCIDEPTIVSNLNAQGWFSYEEIPVGSFLFVDGPATPPLGTGSAQLIVDSTGREIFGTFAYAGTRLDSISELSYATYVDPTSSLPASASLQLDIDANLSDANTAWQGRLVYEPYFTHTVTASTWQTWNTLDNAAAGNWWFSGAPGNLVCPQADPCTWSEVLAAFPDAGVRASIGVLQFKAGGPLPVGLNTSVDDFRINIPTQQSCDIFDYEYVAVCGDGIINGEETCDDGNDQDGDGCSANCAIEQAVCDPQVQLIANGGFEVPIVTDGTGWDIFPNGTSGLDWNVEWVGAYDGAPEIANAELHRGVNGWVSAEGQQHTELDSDWNGHSEGPNGEQASVMIYQDLATVPGETYNIRFQFSPRPGTDISQNVLEFYWDGVLQDTINAAGSGNTVWTVHEYNLTAADGSTRVAFKDAGTPNAEGTFLDDVSVLCTPAPEPFCGDGIVNQRDETCDDGVNNGVVCDPAYGNSCTYCDNACQPVNLTGGYCGDQIVNGQEQCDGTAPEHYSCTDNCALEYLPYCGDGIVNQESEQCDIAAPEGYTCDAQCQLDQLTCEEIPAAVLVSDTHTGLQVGGNALLVAQPYHPAWTANVPGALWIWDGSGVGIVNFTDSLTVIGAVSGDATLRVASDNSYRVWINGVLVGEDPEEWNYAAGHEEDYDITSYLNVGENEFVFEVNNWHGPAGLMYRITYGNTCEPETYCGDGVVNQESEQCDGEDGVPAGYTCDQACALRMTCEEAKSQGLLYGEIDSEGHAIAHNDAEEDFLVSLAVYEMYAPLIEDQTLYGADSKVVEGDSSAEFSVTVPACAYQIDLICGEPLPNNPVYTEEEKLDFDFSEGLEYCVPDEDEDATLVVLEGFPQCGNYVFQCSAHGFEATNYYWYFGDGQIQPNSTNDNVYHTYEENGIYTVTCTATNGEQSASASIEIEAVTCPTCEEAIAMGLLTGEIDSEGHAIVHNNANINYTVSLASYEMYALLIEDQVLFDSDSADVAAFGGETELSVEVPACTYQIDLVCGSPLPFAPLYGDRVIDFDFANQDGAFCVPTGRDDEASVELNIQDGFPQGADYVFMCDADGFVPTGYYWYFGDGQIQPNSPNDNVYHTYTANGDYIVACTATNGTTWQTDTLLVSVEGIVDPSVTVSVDPEYPQGPAYVFLCEADGFTPLGYDWDFGDGEYLYDQLTADVYHEFSANGEYTVTCTASDGETTESGSVQAVVETCGEYELLITQVDPNPAAPEAPFTVSGTLTVGGLPVETETVAIAFDEASQDASVFMGAWLGGFNAPTTPGEYLVSASFNGTCGEPVTASTTLFVEVPQQEGGDSEDELFQTESVEQPLAGSPESNSHGGCAWGYHESDGVCVKDAPAVNTLAFDGGDVAGSNGDGGLLPEESLTEDDLLTEGDDTSGDLLTGAVIGGGLLSWSWLLVLIAIVAILGGAYWWQQQ